MNNRNKKTTNDMKYILLLLSILAIFQHVKAENVYAALDKQCYLVGERMRISVFAYNDNSKLSRVAYIEVSDQWKLHTQSMVLLEKGIGWTEIALPVSMHSGCYQISVYTKAMLTTDNPSVFSLVVGIINPNQLSRKDNIEYLAESYREESFVSCKNYSLNEDITLENRYKTSKFLTVAIEKTGISMKPISENPKELIVPNNSDCSEYYGHIVKAMSMKKDVKGQNIEIQNVRLSFVGKNAMIYDGQEINDSIFQFYTFDAYGNLPVMALGYDSNWNYVPMQILSPYAIIPVSKLPKLTIYCDEAELRNRNQEAQKINAISKYLEVDTLAHSLTFMSTMPNHFYDLDEYTPFNTIREVLVEFVRGAKVHHIGNVNKIFTHDPQTGQRSAWPAIVLIDGIQIDDIDEILNYDAHHIKYIQIYPDRFFFGKTCCSGVISFITRKGRLSNYKLKEGENLVLYSFPQFRPSFQNYTKSNYSTIYWNPFVTEEKLKIMGPSDPGIYSISWQGINEDGTILREIDYFMVSDR